MIGKKLLDGLEAFGELAAENMRVALKRGKKDSTNDLSNSIKVTTSQTGDVVDIAINMEYYGQFVDEGRKRGSFPPPPAIKKWIKDKPIRLKKISLDSAAFLIGRKIQEKGITPFPFIERSIDAAFSEGEDIILDAMENEVAFTIEESFKNNPNFK